ncbi:MAG: hypothetical protein M1831_001030 [Alyxoria varia]|nr:MAG: hypothetical protein M1831_001030 [Alyxoria varia]
MAGNQDLESNNFGLDSDFFDFGEIKLTALPADTNGAADNSWLNVLDNASHGGNLNDGVVGDSNDNTWGSHHGNNASTIDPSLVGPTTQPQYGDWTQNQYPDPTLHQPAPAPYHFHDDMNYSNMLPYQPQQLGFNFPGSSIPPPHSESFSLSPHSNRLFTDHAQNYHQVPQQNDLFVPESSPVLTTRRSARQKGAVNYSEINDPGFNSLSDMEGSQSDGQHSGRNKGGTGMQRFKPEKPKKDLDRPWIRTNTTTQGLSSRTGKINNYDSPYANTPHPLGRRLQTVDNTFNYNMWGELHNTAFQSEAVHDLIYNHPFNQPGYKGPGKLILWVQKAPGDSVRRFHTLASDKCRFDACPCRAFKSRTIAQGHFRVAIDEQWEIHRDSRDPMHVAAYAHLYCMERFLDFADLCYRFDVRADDRDIPTEPTGEWKASLGRETEECRLVKDFIFRAKNGTLRETWPDYPDHSRVQHKGAPKPHHGTLTCALYKAKIETTGKSKMQMMERRGPNPTMFFINLGDLEMQVAAQKARSKGRAKHQNAGNGGKLQMKNAPALTNDDPELMQLAQRNDWDDFGAGAGQKRKADLVECESGDGGRNTRQRTESYVPAAKTGTSIANMSSNYHGNGLGLGDGFDNFPL